ncbi:MAG: pentapeptide repeat-containing protein, partial [Coleofasciculus sp. Co-bin14]|nr:pentapeptide repeat-containing protein [Coleofasciculus sp. Co-bin14]
MNASELQLRYRSGERDFRNAYLPGADLSDTKLLGINLSGADLS